MTPLQAYELARMFAARARVLSEQIAQLGTDIAKPQKAGPVGERELRSKQSERAVKVAALEELCRAESEVRRVLGIAREQT